MENELSILKAEIENLQEWKDSASKVLKNIDFQAVGKALDVELGKDVSTSILPGILKLKEENDKLKSAISDILPDLEKIVQLHYDHDSWFSVEVLVDEMKNRLNELNNG